MKRNDNGFTLIELLIVVAIIAILAAIAIPNFLAAQTRAKVARVNADMRSVATGLESYVIDNNVYVPSDGCPPPWIPPAGNTSEQLYRLTTPIAYISKVPLDRFNAYWLAQYPGASGEGRVYEYYSSDVPASPPGLNASLGQGLWYPPNQGGGYWPGQKGNHKWVLISLGPCQQPWWQYNGLSVWPYIGYDPTNGVVSLGILDRLGP